MLLVGLTRIICVYTDSIRFRDKLWTEHTIKMFIELYNELWQGISNHQIHSNSEVNDGHPTILTKGLQNHQLCWILRVRRMRSAASLLYRNLLLSWRNIWFMSCQTNSSQTVLDILQIPPKAACTLQAFPHIFGDSSWQSPSPDLKHQATVDQLPFACGSLNVILDAAECKRRHWNHPSNSPTKYTYTHNKFTSIKTDGFWSQLIRIFWVQIGTSHAICIWHI